MVSVIKRDGRVEEYSLDKIKRAISLCLRSCGVKEINYFYLLEKRFSFKDVFKITEIESEVYGYLTFVYGSAVADSYKSYKDHKQIKREQTSSMVKNIKNIVLDVDKCDFKNDNANKDSKIITTQRDLIAGEVCKHIALNEVLPNNIAKAHIDGLIHFHDLDYSPLQPMFNCMLIDIKNMFDNGFKMGNATITKPKSIGTATSLVSQILAHIASNIYGGCTVANIDIVLEEYVEMSYKKLQEKAKKYDIRYPFYVMEELEKEVYDAFQSLEYEINTLYSGNGQTPFCTLGFGLGTSSFSKMIQKAILQNRINGLGEDKVTAVFPKLVYAIKDGHNSEKRDPFYDVKQLALECSSKRIYPDILNYDNNIEITGGFKFPMGCRSFLHEWQDPKTGKSIYDGRFNVGVVTINLPKLAIESKGEPILFVKKLEETLTNIVKPALLERIERFRGIKASVSPILYQYGACGVRLKPNDDIFQLIENGRASVSIGYIGLHEVLVHLSLENEDGVKILELMKEYADTWTKETGYAFSLYGTPAEKLCERFCEIDKQNYGVIEGVTDKGYYTNSFHIPVTKKIHPKDKIELEKPYLKLSKGGHICYVETPNLSNNISALETLWDISNIYGIDYFGVNQPIDKCFECGFSGELEANLEGFVCPICGNNDSTKLSCIRRVSGYLGAPNSRPFNKGKQKEVINRVKHY